MRSFEVHSNESACRKSGRLGLEQVSVMLLLRLIPARFYEVSHSIIVRVFHKLVKRSTIPETESKQYALENLRVIINALEAL